MTTRYGRHSASLHGSEVGHENDIGSPTRDVSVNRRSAPRREINRSNPLPSYAYGATVDQAALRQAAVNREADSSLEAKREGSRQSEQLPETTVNGTAPAAARYAQIKATQQAKAQSERIKAQSARPRSSRAGPSQQRGVRSAPVPGGDSSDEAEEVLSATGAERGLVAASSSHRNRGGGGGSSINDIVHSFYVYRDSDNEDVGLDQLAPLPGRAIEGNNLLRGAQRPAHDLFSSAANASFSIRSNSDAGDPQYDYAQEDAYARQAETERARAKGKGKDAGNDNNPTTPRASLASSVQNWVQKVPIPSFRASNGHHAGPSGAVAAGQVGEAEASGAARQKSPASEDDVAYRYEAQGENDDNESETSNGKKHSHRRKGDESRGHGTGQDAANIWASDKRKSGNSREAASSDKSGGPVMTDSAILHNIPGGPGRSPDRSSIDRVLSAPLALVSSASARRRSLAWLATALLALGAAYVAKSSGVGLSLPSGFGSSRHTGRSTFNVPALSPATQREWASRIDSIEAELLRLDRRTTSLEDESAVRAMLLERVTALEKDARSTRTRLHDVEKDTKAETKKNQARMQQLESAGRKSRDELDGLRVQLSQVDSSGSSKQDRSDSTLSDTEATIIKQRITSLEETLQDTEKKLHLLTSHVDSIAKIAASAKDSLNALEKKLPKMLPAKLDPKTLKFHIDKQFFEDFKKLLSDADVVTRKGTQQLQPSKESWNSFFAANKKALREIQTEEVKRELDSRLETGAVLSRDAFMDLLHLHLNRAKEQLENTFNTNASTLQQDVLAKVRQQQDMYERSGSWTARRSSGTTASQRTQATHHWANDLPDIPLITKDGTDARGALLAMIEAALEAHSADRLGRNDFALYTAGARPVLSLTSEDYGTAKSRERTWGSWFRRGLWHGAEHKVPLRSPALALHHDNAPGNCWPFAGDQGNLGIQLARKAVVEEISVEHIPRSIAFEGASSAPKDISVWGRVDEPSDRARLHAHRHQAMLDKVRNETKDADAAPLPPDQDSMLLGSFMYDISEGSRTIQTFPASEEARALRIPVQIVQVLIASNHGHKHYTCLYRIRIHGYEWNGTEDEHNGLVE